MKQVATMRDIIFEWFHHFHENPEVSWKEVNTTKKIASILDSFNIKYHLFDDVTGIIAEIGEGKDVIAVRADIDALWQEVDGVMRANHSCGHDANMSMVLGAMYQLKDMSLNKRIRFIFQPAEETGGGALSMIERHVLKDVTHLFGVHLRPAEELPLGKVAPAIHHGAAVFLEGKIHGIDAHGARPHQGKNAVDVLMAIQQLLKNLHVDPFEAYSAKLTKMVADGGSVNIIPGNATFSLDVRAQKNEVISKLQAHIEKGFTNIAALFDVSIEWEWLDMTPGAEVSEEAASIAERSIIEELGTDYLAPAVVTPGSDDFHFYTIQEPSLKAAMIGVGADLTPGLHHPKMTFKKEALLIGAKVLTTTLKNAARG
ncbi:amidohydrolase [Lysinibacillus sp. 54212]|uniref:amidohydrolase n=1 Tax=Lysinibacillus sp. 54212 TaxID=3119829 RepID=UPI002FC9D139